MAHLRSICTAILLSSAITSRSSVAQGASTSLTHTVSVTVPPRIKVKVGSAIAPTSGVQKQASSNGLSLSINATRGWSLSIGSTSHKLQWSRDGRTGFAAITADKSIVATGTLSPVTTSATIFVRPSTDARMQSSDGDFSDAVFLTIVAQ